ncbi:hypothetical protein [Primorskyibacter sp. S87]|uniref:hypothetical protein n=1 Tax=Primorskyibacter sp. S87 TaxID=3415126 RepID=UPI003C7B351A
MVDDHLLFNQRVNRLTRKHRAMARGYKAQMQPDGLIVMKPRGRRAGISLRPILYAIAMLLLFKGFLVAHLGVPGYSDRLARLEEGTAVEKAGAWAMQIDPVTQLIADQIYPYLH